MGRLSIVTTIYTSDRLGDFQNLIASVAKQITVPELIVVVEGSATLAEQVSRILSGLPTSPRTILSPPGVGLSGARNLGARAAVTDYVGFVDDDAILDHNWTFTVINELDASKDVIGITGITVPQWVNQEDAWIPRSLYWLIGCSDPRAPHKKEFVDWASGTNMVFRRELFDKILFDERLGGIKAHGKPNLAGDENDFVLRLVRITGSHVLFSPHVRVLHKVSSYKASSRYIRKYSMMQGYAEARYNSMYGEIHRHTVRRAVLLGLMHDLLSSPHDLLYRRLTAFMNFGIFALIGYLAYQFPWLLVLGGAGS